MAADLVAVLRVVEADPSAVAPAALDAEVLVVLAVFLAPVVEVVDFEAAVFFVAVRLGAAVLRAAVFVGVDSALSAPSPAVVVAAVLAGAALVAEVVPAVLLAAGVLAAVVFLAALLLRATVFFAAVVFFGAVLPAAPLVPASREPFCAAVSAESDSAAEA